VQNALITLGKNRLIMEKFKNVHFSFEKISNWKLIIHSANNITFVDHVFISDVEKTKLNVFTCLCVLD